MAGYVDLHCHYLPGVDDGVRTYEEGVELCRGLAGLGYERVVATPHIRTAMFENEAQGLAASFEAFRARAEAEAGMPSLGLGAEHFFDDVFWQLVLDRRTLPFVGGRAALVEFPESVLPYRVEDRFYEMRVQGIRPVLAHPERYATLARGTDPLDPLLEVGAVAQLDVMSLTGKYGRQARRVAERLLEEGVYYLASSDCHRARDLPVLAEGLERLRALAGAEEADRLLSEHPRRVLEGRVDE